LVVVEACPREQKMKRLREQLAV